MCSLTSYHVLLAEFGEFLTELYALKLTVSYQQQLVHQSPSWLVSIATLLARIQHLAQINNHVEDIMGSISLGNPWQPNHIKNNILRYQGGFLAKERNFFHLPMKKLNYLQWKDFLQYKCVLYLRQPLNPPQFKIIAYRTSNHKLAMGIGQWTTILISSWISEYCWILS